MGVYEKGGEGEGEEIVKLYLDSSRRESWMVIVLSGGGSTLLYGRGGEPFTEQVTRMSRFTCFLSFFHSIHRCLPNYTHPPFTTPHSSPRQPPQ